MASWAAFCAETNLYSYNPILQKWDPLDREISAFSLRVVLGTSQLLPSPPRQQTSNDSHSSSPILEIRKPNGDIYLTEKLPIAWNYDVIEPPFFHQLCTDTLRLGIHFSSKISAECFLDAIHVIQKKCSKLLESIGYDDIETNGIRIDFTKTSTVFPVQDHGVVSFSAGTNLPTHIIYFFKRILEQELKKYSKDVLANVFGVKEIYIVQDLEFRYHTNHQDNENASTEKTYRDIMETLHHRHWNGIPIYDKGILILCGGRTGNEDVSGWDPEYARRTVHHELFHFLWFQTFYGGNSLNNIKSELVNISSNWHKFNGEGFRYLENGQSDEIAGDLNDEKDILEHGFLNHYCRVSMEEDMAEVYGAVMLHGQEKLLSFLLSAGESSCFLGVVEKTQGMSKLRLLLVNS